MHFKKSNVSILNDEYHDRFQSNHERFRFGQERFQFGHGWVHAIRIDCLKKAMIR
jgi:hypothetical protein